MDVTCPTGKVGHRSRAAARRAAINAAIARTHHRLRSYHCPDCHRWHLSSAPPIRAPHPRGRKAPVHQPTPATPAEVDAWFAQHGKTANQ